MVFLGKNTLLIRNSVKSWMVMKWCLPPLLTVLTYFSHKYHTLAYTCFINKFENESHQISTFEMITHGDKFITMLKGIDFFSNWHAY